MSFNKKFFTTGGIVASSPAAGPVNPLENFAPFIYTGNSTTGRSITGLGFQPDLIWNKQRNGSTGHILTDSVRGITKSLQSNNTNAEFTQSYYTSFDIDGWTFNNIAINSSPETFVNWCFKAGGAAVSNTDGTTTSQVSANRDAGFSIVKYTAGGTANVGHGLSSAPELIINKITNTNNTPWVVYNSISGTGKYLFLNDSASIATNSAIFPAVTDSTFSQFWSGNSYPYISYCFHSVDGYQKVGSYTGNGSALGQTITELGFDPRFLLVKNATSPAGWRITDSVRGDNIYLFPNSASGDDSNSGYISLITDGFRLNGLDSNTSDTFIYLAIA